MQIYSVNGTKMNNTNFKGITKAMSRKVFLDGKKDVLNFLLQRGDKNTRVGTLPPCIYDKLRSLNKIDRENAIKEICSVFEECAHDIRAYVPSITGPAEEYKNKRPNSSVEKMRKVLNKYGVLDKPENFDLIYLDKGEYKGAYKMEGLKEDKTGDIPCYKVFHKVDNTPEWHKYKCHGNYAELNSAAYWRKAEGNYSDINRLYCGDMKSGYLIDRLIQQTTPRPKVITCMYDYGTKNTDAFQFGNGHNIMNGFLFDQGGYRVINRVKNTSKIARYVLKQLKETPEEQRWIIWNKIRTSSSYKHLDKTQKIAGLGLAIKHLNPKYQEKATELCLGYKEPFIDMAVAYALKYMPYETSLKYFPVLLKRNNPEVQTVVLNEIPLLSKTDNLRFDDINTPRHKVDPVKVNKYYQIAKYLVLDETREHLASYVHLLPKNIMQKEADKLIAYNTHEINDRLLHKIKYEPTDPEEYSFGDKMEIITKIQQNTQDPFIRQKSGEVKRKVINDYNDDGD